MRVALIGFGGVGRELARLIETLGSEYSFQVVGIHTRRHGTRVEPGGIPLRETVAQQQLGPAASSVEAFLDACRPEVAVELTTLDPLSGEPAISHIRAAFARGIHVVTANKGPLAFAYHELDQLARERGCRFLFESTVMDGAPVFNLVRNCLPALRVLGFTGVLNSTCNIVIDALEQGGTFEQGVEQARALGVTEANASYDTEGWDSAAKVAALANVLLGARITPAAVGRRGIGRLTPARLRELNAAGKTVRLVSRGSRSGKFRVRAEVLAQSDLLASPRGTTTLLLLDTDRMGTLGTIDVAPTLAQTAYGVLADLIEVWRELRTASRELFTA